MAGGLEGGLGDGRGRFEVSFDGGRVWADYVRGGETVIVRHVEADLPLRGTGAAGRFMQALVEEARKDGLKLAPRCSYAVWWLDRHPEAGDVLAAAR